jgi:hypothetical protein
VVKVYECSITEDRGFDARRAPDFLPLGPELCPRGLVVKVSAF